MQRILELQTPLQETMLGWGWRLRTYTWPTKPSELHTQMSRWPSGPEVADAQVNCSPERVIFRTGSAYRNSGGGFLFSDSSNLCLASNKAHSKAARFSALGKIKVKLSTPSLLNGCKLSGRSASK